jgi:hypothetical protein
MSMPITRTAIIPVWLLVFWLLVLSRSPITFATGAGLLLVGGAVLTVLFALWKGPRTIAAMPTLDPSLATVSSAAFVPNSWPNSGFRNSRQRGARGG